MSSHYAETSGAQEVLVEPFLSRACVSGTILLKKKVGGTSQMCAILARGRTSLTACGPILPPHSCPFLADLLSMISFTN